MTNIALRLPRMATCACALLCALMAAHMALAHAVTLGDKGYIQEITGPQILPFLYLGAKHMITGYDHILFLFGVIFFLYGMKEIATYVTLFAIGHSTTMIIGVWFNIGINAYIIDAIIGFSVVYKALDNLGAFRKWFGVQPDTRAATLIFGLLHGFGLASKIIEYNISQDGLLPNLIAFNIGVEIGQLTALALILAAMRHWRASPSFAQGAYRANVIMIGLGVYLTSIQLVGFMMA